MDVFTYDDRYDSNPVMKPGNLLKIILNPVDVFAIILAFQCSYVFTFYGKGGYFFNEPNLLNLFLGGLPLWLLILSLVKISGIPVKRYKALFFLYLQSSIAVFFILLLLYYFLRLYPVPPLFITTLPLFGFIFLYLGRMIVYKILKLFRSKGVNHLNIVLIADDSSVELIEGILSKKEMKFHVVVIFSESELIKEKYESTSIILPEKFTGILTDLIEVDFIDEVIYLKSMTDACKVREILSICNELGVTFRLRQPDAKHTISSALTIRSNNGMFLNFKNIPNNTFVQALKKTMDPNIALLTIVVLSPLLALFSILILFTSGGPVVIKQPKTGYRGKQILVYRFRTSVVAKKQISGADYDELESGIDSIVNDTEDKPQLTFIGLFLSNTGLDQLPQLFNVLKGEIPIVGPRYPLHNKDLFPRSTES